MYRNALLMLIGGALSAGIQMGVSQAVRGSSAPVNVRFYVTALTLFVFALLRLPPARARTDFTQPVKGNNDKAAAGGATLIVCGIVTLTTPLWAGPTHLSASGTNWVYVLQIPLNMAGWGMTLAGLGLLIVASIHARLQVTGARLVDVP